MKDKTLEVFTVPEDELFIYRVLLYGVDPLLYYWKIKEVELVHNTVDGIRYGSDEIRFTACPPEVQPTEVAELRAQGKKVLEDILARARNGDITANEGIDLCEKASSGFGFKDFHLELDIILTSICEKRGLGVGQKITKVELTNDGVEFTMVRG